MLSCSPQAFLCYCVLSLAGSRNCLISHVRPQKTEQDRTGSYRTVRDNTRPYRTIRAHSRPYQTLRDFTRPYGTIRDQLDGHLDWQLDAELRKMGKLGNQILIEESGLPKIFLMLGCCEAIMLVLSKKFYMELMNFCISFLSTKKIVIK